MIILALASICSAYLTRVAVANQERVRPILGLSCSPEGNHGPDIGYIHVRIFGEAPAIPLHVVIARPRGLAEEFDRAGVSAVEGKTALFPDGTNLRIYDGCLFTLTYGEVNGRQQVSRLRCDFNAVDRFVWVV